MNIQKYMKTAQMTLRGQTNGGIVYLIPNIIVRLLYLVPLMFLWRVIMNNGVDTGISTAQVLTYTYMNSLLSEMLIVETAASSWCYEGMLQSLYLRPISIFGHLIAQTIGGWIPMFLTFTLPMLLAAPLFGIAIIPKSFLFFPSLILCISLGFAMDFLFVCLTIRLRGMSWLVHVIRMAILSMFSGSVIPFKLFPFGLSKILEMQPFGSLGGAPLSIFAGISEPIHIITVQIFWNIILWPLVIIIFKKSQEGVISYGG